MVSVSKPHPHPQPLPPPPPPPHPQSRLVAATAVVVSVLLGEAETEVKLPKLPQGSQTATTRATCVFLRMMRGRGCFNQNLTVPMTMLYINLGHVQHVVVRGCRVAGIACL